MGVSPYLAFLGLTHLFSFLNSEYLLNIHKQINFLVKNFGYTYRDVMHMPTFSRLIFINEIKTEIGNKTK